MRLPIAATLLFSLAACAGSGATTGGTQVTPTHTTATERIALTGGGQVNINAMNLDTDVRLFSTGTVDQVWAALPLVYADLGIPLTVNNSQTKVIGNEGWKVRRSIARVPLHRYLDCGSSGTMRNAETYEVTLSIVTTIVPNPNGGSVVSTAISGVGRNPITSNTNPVRCASLGDLEIRVRDMVQRRVEAM